jgi:hypothetical protein
MQRPVGVAVTAMVQPVPVDSARTGQDRRRPSQVRERGLPTQPLGTLPGGGDQQLPGVIDPNRLELQQPGRGPADQWSPAAGRPA